MNDAVVAGANRAHPKKLLVIDDQSRYVDLLFELMRGYDYATRCELPGPCWECDFRPECELTHAHDWAETEQALLRHEDLSAVLLDLRFDLPEARLLPSNQPLTERKNTEGLRILSRVRALRPRLPVILMTSERNLKLDELSPIDADEYVTLAGRDSLDVRALELLIEATTGQHRTSPDDYVWGATRVMRDLQMRAEALRATSLPVLLLGETGTGKSALAKEALHHGDGAFVAVDLSTIPDTLIAAELFGSVKGAFSGAVDRRGLFEEANGGTLFLDEIGNLDHAAQRMLLVALQDGVVTRLGETKARQMDVKVIAATNVDLADAVRRGAFRGDLYARLNPGAALVLPPLRDRRSDLRPLMKRFATRAFDRPRDRALFERYCDHMGVEVQAVHLAFGQSAGQAAGDGVTFVLSDASMARIKGHPFWGNVRELELLVKNALLMTLANASVVTQAQGAVRHLPVSSRLVARLLGQSVHVGQSVHGVETRGKDSGEVEVPKRTTENPSATRGESNHFTVQIELTRGPHLGDTARSLERALYERLFVEEQGDLRKMALRLLKLEDFDESEDAEKTAERRLRTRFQQLGLSVKVLRKRLFSAGNER